MCFTRYFDWLTNRVFIAHDDMGQLSGYLFAQTHSIGPWAARRPQDAEALLAAALALTYEAPSVVRVPSSNLAVTELLQRNGFEIIETLAHMRRGGDKMPGKRTLIYGLTSFALG
jgi:hypothetical protein